MANPFMDNPAIQLVTQALMARHQPQQGTNPLQSFLGGLPEPLGGFFGHLMHPQQQGTPPAAPMGAPPALGGMHLPLLSRGLGGLGGGGMGVPPANGNMPFGLGRY